GDRWEVLLGLRRPARVRNGPRLRHRARRRRAVKHRGGAVHLALRTPPTRPGAGLPHRPPRRDPLGHLPSLWDGAPATCDRPTVPVVSPPPGLPTLLRPLPGPRPEPPRGGARSRGDEPADHHRDVP